ncbi:hypothetical protein [Nonlabens dokdonensis]|uniref:hypothetical protein n=1 Tax=Nonlabens dokdonensis TaxID=328515 RepID=UPI0026F32E27|nr:hypothetical protein [Nonlabens dokdonensis]
MNTIHSNYEVIGSIGYHQVGQPDQYLKRLVENSVILNIILEPPFKIPDFMIGKAILKIKTFFHDMGSYDELVIHYDDDQIIEWEESLLEEDNWKAAQFYCWLDEMQTWDFESQELLDKCQEIYNRRNQNPNSLSA